jgi:hypothetical protein
MGKIVRLTESDLVRLVKRVINEQRATGAIDTPYLKGDILQTEKGKELKVLDVKLGAVTVILPTGKKTDLEVVLKTNKLNNPEIMGGPQEIRIVGVKRGQQQLSVLPNGKLMGMGAELN